MYMSAGIKFSSDCLFVLQECIYFVEYFSKYKNDKNLRYSAESQIDKKIFI
jgi:hypothetical protein